MAVQTYTKRGLQGRYKAATNRIIYALREETGDSTLPLQYEPSYNESEFTITMGTADSPNTVVQEMFSGGSTKTTVDNAVEREGSRTVFPVEAE